MDVRMGFSAQGCSLTYYTEIARALRRKFEKTEKPRISRMSRIEVTGKNRKEPTLGQGSGCGRQRHRRLLNH
jgi:hypothetical protein